MNVKRFTIAYIAYVSLKMNPVSWDVAARALFAFLLIVGLTLIGLVTQNE